MILATLPKRRYESHLCFDTAICDLEPIARKSNDFAYYQEQLGVCYGGRARWWLGEKKLELAREDVRSARELLEKLQNPKSPNPYFLSDLGEIIAIDFDIWRADGAKYPDRGRALVQDAISCFEKAMGVDPNRFSDAEQSKVLGKQRESLSR
jgi:tetratricopeptide (TPR) repeat protein